MFAIRLIKIGAAFIFLSVCFALIDFAKPLFKGVDQNNTITTVRLNKFFKSRPTVIRENLDKIIKEKATTRAKNTLTEKEKEKIVDILYKFGEQYYGINHKLVLAILAAESSYYKYAKGKNYRYKYKRVKKNGKYTTIKKKYLHSYDLGLGQQNSKYWRKRYKHIKLLNKKLEILPSELLSVNNVYNVYSNVMATVYFLSYCIENNRNYSKVQQVECYNKGLYGARKTKNNKYYKKVVRYMRLIDS